MKYHLTVSKDGNEASLSQIGTIGMKSEIQNVFIDGQEAFIIDKSGTIYSFRFADNRLSYIKNISKDILGSEMTCVIRDGMTSLCHSRQRG